MIFLYITTSLYDQVMIMSKQNQHYQVTPFQCSSGIDIYISQTKLKNY